MINFQSHMKKYRSNLLVIPEHGRIDRVFPSSGIYRENVGHVHHMGYRLIQHDGRLQFVHRLIWEFVHGPIPIGFFVDHINCDKLDNRISNLRLVTRKQNMENQSTGRKNNTSGFRGVFFNKKSGNWRASITSNKKNVALGSFESPELAYQAYCKAANKLHTHNASSLEKTDTSNIS